MSVNRPSTGNPLNIAEFERVRERYSNGNRSFIDQLESTLPGTRDGKVNKAESQQAYATLLAQAGDQIPQKIKDRFKDGQAFADQFEKIDALGVADGYVDEEEFSKFLSSEGDTSTSGASAEEPPKPEASSAEASDSSAEEPPKPEPAPADN